MSKFGDVSQHQSNTKKKGGIKRKKKKKTILSPKQTKPTNNKEKLIWGGGAGGAERQGGRRWKGMGERVGGEVSHYVSQQWKGPPLIHGVRRRKQTRGQVRSRFQTILTSEEGTFRGIRILKQFSWELNTGWQKPERRLL